MPNKYDVESDVDTIAKFGYKPTKKTYKGSNTAGIPAYQRSITRIKDKHTGDEAVIKRSTKYEDQKVSILVQKKHLKGQDV